MSVHSKIEPARRTNRTRVLMTGLLITQTGNVRVTIRDISRTGAQMICKDKIAAGSDVLVKRGELFAAAHVAWVKDGEVGIRFYRELSPHEIEGTLPAALLRNPAGKAPSSPR